MFFVFVACILFMFLSSLSIQIYFMIPFLLTKYLTHLFIHSYSQDYVSNLQQNFYSSIACNICCFAISTLLILMDLNQITPLPPFRYRISVLSCLHWPICISCRESFMNKICIPLWSPQASAKPQIRV